MLDSRSLSVFTRMARARARQRSRRAPSSVDSDEVGTSSSSRAAPNARTAPRARRANGAARVRRANERGDATRLVDMAGRRRRANSSKSDASTNVPRGTTTRAGRRRGSLRLSLRRDQQLQLQMPREITSPMCLTPGLDFTDDLFPAARVPHRQRSHPKPCPTSDMAGKNAKEELDGKIMRFEPHEDAGCFMK